VLRRARHSFERAAPQLVPCGADYSQRVAAQV